MSAPYSGIHSTAVIGDPPEHRDYRARAEFNLNSQPFPPLISTSSLIEAFVTVDAGCYRHTKIGARTWLMKKVHVGHDSVIGDDCEIAPLVSIGGECLICDRVKVGQGAVFKPRVTVGEGAVIGAGAVVTKDVPAGETWVGNPARPLVKSGFEELSDADLAAKLRAMHGKWRLVPGGWLNSDPGDEQPE